LHFCIAFFFGGHSFSLGYAQMGFFYFFIFLFFGGVEVKMLSSGTPGGSMSMTFTWFRGLSC
jgi:hypothetical protein